MEDKPVLKKCQLCHQMLPISSFYKRKATDRGTPIYRPVLMFIEHRQTEETVPIFSYLSVMEVTNVESFLIQRSQIVLPFPRQSDL